MILNRISQGLTGSAAASGLAGGLAGSAIAGAIRERDDAGAPLLLRAMIAAAASDGHMDSVERGRIFAEAGKPGLSQEEKVRLFDELQHPRDLQQIVAEVNKPETAVEVYAVSLIAIGDWRPEAHVYLRSLALALELPGEIIESVHQQVAIARHQAVAA